MAALHILLIDDEVHFAATMAKRLRKRGFVVHEAGSGPEGLRLLEESPIDAVVLDVKMPEMDGIQALREIRVRFPKVAVIMLTGHADMESTISGMAMGAFDYLMKPADLDELVRTLLEACDRGRKMGEGSGVGVPPA